VAGQSLSVPPFLARRANRVVRPRDASEVFANPRKELARLARTGVARRLCTGYYVMVPQHRLGDTSWQPELHGAALGIAVADYGVDAVALMGLSAARLHGAIPRALAVTVVAVPKQRPALRIGDGRVLFVERDVTRLDTERVDTEVTAGWVTTVEQTALDLAARPTVGGLPERDVAEAVGELVRRADGTLLTRLSHEQHRPAALRRLREWTGQAGDA
jgi:hypothetical protein